MIIEIRGTGFKNKGAELMLHAILQKVGNSFSDACFAMAPSGNQDYIRRAKLGLYQKVRLRKFDIPLGGMIPSKLRQRYRQLYGLVLDNDVDVVLDASGFAYSEQWGEYPSVTMASYVKTWKKHGTKIVLLPQAMGPVTCSNIRKAFSYVVHNADLVFARDDVSYKHVTDLVGERENVLKAPDFTNLIPGIIPPDPERFRGRFCLVPNCRMIDKTLDDQSTRYLFFCVECIKYLVESGHKPFILIHGGSQDLQLAQKIVSESGEEIEIIEETDALKIKGILGLCGGVISSRYHGLISALSQGTPSLASGWSHKYEMLFEEYGVPEGCLSVSIESKALNKQIRRITDDDSQKEIITKITKASNMYKEQTEAMWKKVFSVIEK
jgi:colanic acid/amylovoran biosynthesis protein